MTKDLITFLSHNFCVYCCGDMKKLHCDHTNVTCDRLANFLTGCNLYKATINEEELERLAETVCKELEQLGCEFSRQERTIIKSVYKAGYRKALDF